MTEPMVLEWMIHDTKKIKCDFCWKTSTDYIITKTNKTICATCMNLYMRLKELEANGEFIYIPKTELKCSECNGSGKIYEHGEPINCPRCNEKED